jgi:hypothetical protein
MDKAKVIDMATMAIFGQPLVNNVHRAILAEAIIAAALGEPWRWCSGDWALCDFDHPDGTRLEVKQSATKQSWHKDGEISARPSFDIASRKMAWDGHGWVPSAGRNADIYVFAFHSVADAGADHREPSQWEFYVVPTTALPATKKITLTSLRGLVASVPYADLRSMVDDVHRRLLASTVTSEAAAPESPPAPSAALDVRPAD